MSDEATQVAARNWFIANRGERASWAETQIGFEKFHEMIGWMADFASSQACLARIEGMESAAKAMCAMCKANRAGIHLECTCGTWMHTDGWNGRECEASAIRALIEQEKQKHQK